MLMTRIEELEKELDQVCSTYESDCKHCPKAKECEEYARLYEAATSSEKSLLVSRWRRESETAEERAARTFEHYKKRIEMEDGVYSDSGIRFNVIEYLCRFPEINPYEMGAAILKDGFLIVFDDSSISAAENKRKEKEVRRCAR